MTIKPFELLKFLFDNTLQSIDCKLKKKTKKKLTNFIQYFPDDLSTGWYSYILNDKIYFSKLS